MICFLFFSFYVCFPPIHLVVSLFRTTDTTSQHLKWGENLSYHRILSGELSAVQNNF